MIDLAAVESLVAVERCGSVGGAAAELGFTPSAVSQQVKRLERQVGATLLERAGRGVVLTAAGRRLVDEGRVLGEQVERLRSRLQGDAGRPSGLLRLAAFSTAVRGIVPPLLAELARSAPDLDVVVHEVEPWDAVAEVAAGRTDVAIVHRWEGMRFHVPPSLRGEPVLTDVADLLVHRDDPLAARERRGARRPARPRLGVHAGGHDLPRVVRPHVPRHARGPRGWPTGASSSPRRSSWWRTGWPSPSCRAWVAADCRMPWSRSPVRDPEPTRRVDVHWRASMSDAPAVAAVRAALRGVRGAPSGCSARGASARW